MAGTPRILELGPCRADPSPGPLLGLDEGAELLGRDELVLGPADHLGEAAERGQRVERQVVVDEVAQLRAQLAQQQDLADLVEDAAAVRPPASD